MNPQVEPDHYSKYYDTKERFCTYWHQIQEILLLNPKTVLEVGIGNSFVSKYVKEQGFNIITLDVDKRLNPDVVGSVLDVPFSNKAFQVVACYELLEHLPYGNFDKAMSEMSRVSSLYTLLSLPDVNIVYRVNIQIPIVGEVGKLIPFPRLKKPKHHFDGQHYWEIGKAGYSLGMITNDIEKAGFSIEKTYRVAEMPYHRLFVLKKTREYDKNKR